MKKGDPLAKGTKPKARTHLLDEILEQKLVEVLNKIDLTWRQRPRWEFLMISSES